MERNKTLTERYKEQREKLEIARYNNEKAAEQFREARSALLEEENKFWNITSMCLPEQYQLKHRIKNGKMFFYYYCFQNNECSMEFENIENLVDYTHDIIELRKNKEPRQFVIDSSVGRITITVEERTND